MGLDGEAGEADGGDAWMGEALWPRQALKEYFELLTALQENMREYEDLQVRDAAQPRPDRNGRPKRPEPTVAERCGGHRCWLPRRLAAPDDGDERAGGDPDPPRLFGRRRPEEAPPPQAETRPVSRKPAHLAQGRETEEGLRVWGAVRAG